MSIKRSDDQYSEQEAQRRFEKLVKAALNTPPKPMNEIKRRRAKSPQVTKSSGRKKARKKD